jgi:hypothetical protein
LTVSSTLLRYEHTFRTGMMYDVYIPDWFFCIEFQVSSAMRVQLILYCTTCNLHSVFFKDSNTCFFKVSDLSLTRRFAVY